MAALFLASLLVFAQAVCTDAYAQQNAPRLDPAGWGGDHVGQPVPEYIDSGECLFCHRLDVGEAWAKDRHNLTLRDAGPEEPALAALTADAAAREFASQVELLLGGGRQTRFLKRSAAYGKLELLSVRAHQGRGRRFLLSETDGPHWDAQAFGDRCAGCHATGVDSRERTFSAISLDCYVCHGAAPLEHANDAHLMPLAKKRNDPPRIVASICGQCHLRGGKSRSTGHPYPNNFVAGDNLFKDFQVDWAKADDPQLINPGDRHVWRNIRSIAVDGREDMTCLTCHAVHGRSTARHRALADEQYCGHCHDPGRAKSFVRQYEAHSKLCEY
ncbi:MAG: hypothetical protein HY000_20440 [Planctomycetes bacterium]|nr:hypothetical protein [Planctomycetota bacterium]